MVSTSSSSASWFPWTQWKTNRTRRGMLVAFKPTVSRVLADIPARVVDIGPRFRSGNCLVTLEFARPVTYHNEVIQRIDALRSELYPVEDRS